MKHIYHFCAECNGGYSAVRMDGILTLNQRVMCMEDYHRVKWLLRAEFNVPDDTAISITSLTYLHSEET